jgi:hypothetical protein
VHEKKPVRVCDICFDLLNPSHGSEKTESMTATAGGDSPAESDEEEEAAAEREIEARMSVEEGELDDFNDFLAVNGNPALNVESETLKTLPSPPPKPPRAGRATVVNASVPETTSSNAKREPRATIAGVGNRPAPRRSLLAGITSTVLKPTGGLFSSFGNSFSLTRSTSNTSNTSNSSASSPLSPNYKESSSSNLSCSPKGVSFVPPPQQQQQAAVVLPSEKQVPVRDTSPAPEERVGGGSRRPRRTNLIIKQNPVLEELQARLEREREQDKLTEEVEES